MLTLGLHLGFFVTKTVKSLVESYFGEGERDGLEETSPEPGCSTWDDQYLCVSTTGNTAAEVESETTAAAVEPCDQEEHAASNADFPPKVCKQVCMFPDEFHSSWMNATTQAVLNLTAVQRKLRQRPSDSLIRLSRTPTFARLFLTALKNPGKHMRDIYWSLMELSHVHHNLRLFQENDALNLLDPLLLWLENCGVHTTIQETRKTWCENCDYSGSSTSSLGTIYFLPQPCSGNKTVSSLLRGAFSQMLCMDQCPACDSNIEKGNFWNSPDILAISRSHVPDESGQRGRVAASDFVTIQVNPDETQTYKLSSVICYSASNEHYWPYLSYNFITSMVDNEHVSVVPGYMTEDMSEEIYLYEKV